MSIKSITSTLAFVLSVVLLPLFASAATISTGVANWKFAGFTALPLSPNSGTLYSDTIAATGSNAVSIAPNGAWVTPATVGSTTGLKWISALSNGASQGLYGLYEYELKLTAPPLAPGTYQISGKFTSDNLVDSFKINGNEVLTSYVGPTQSSYQFVYSLPVTTAGTDITLRARIYNESTEDGVIGPFGAYPTGPNAPSSTTNPTGFILDGKAVLVPTPQASLAGMSLLGVMGLMGFMKKRRKLQASELD